MESEQKELRRNRDLAGGEGKCTTKVSRGRGGEEERKNKAAGRHKEERQTEKVKRAVEREVKVELCRQELSFRHNVL